ncbi:MAG: thiamine phosphate synthase [Vibrio gallaecicus]
MTVKILIPTQIVELTGEIQHCLLIAKQQGFAINHVELGVSPTPYFSLVEEDSTTNIGFNGGGFELNRSVEDFVLEYNQTIPFDVLLERLSSSEQSIFVGLKDTDRRLDIWSTLDGNRAIQTSRKPNDVDTYRHISWFVTLLALDFPIEDALVVANAASNVPRETWPNSFDVFPVPILEDKRLGIHVGWAHSNNPLTFPSLIKSSLGLYPVVDDVGWIETLLKLGVKTIQLRIKNPNQADLEEQVKQAICLGQKYQAQVFINDYWKLALKHQAFGVHLGQEDIEESNLLQLSEAGIRLGLSTHGYYELLRIIQINPSYIALGHIFPTTTKQMPSKPQGLVRLGLYQQLIDTIPYSQTTLGYPTVAIGGIDQHTAPEVWDCGVSSLAVVRAITLADSPKDVVNFFDDLINKNPRQEIQKPTFVHQPLEISHAE